MKQALVKDPERRVTSAFAKGGDVERPLQQGAPAQDRGAGLNHAALLVVGRRASGEGAGLPGGRSSPALVPALAGYG